MSKREEMKREIEEAIERSRQTPITPEKKPERYRLDFEMHGIDREAYPDDPNKYRMSDSSGTLFFETLDEMHDVSDKVFQFWCDLEMALCQKQKNKQTEG